MVQTNLERSVIPYKNLSERFTAPSPDFNKQYCTIYVKRIEQMRLLFEERIKQKWGDEYQVCKLHKLVEDNLPKCVVIGTIFKDQKLKPSVLKHLAEANQLVPQPILKHFTAESDMLFIEDELQRYELLGLLDKDRLVTGITIAILGTDQGQGKLIVHDYCYTGFLPQIERPLPTEDYHIVFISGLDLINVEKSLLPLQFFINWISGLWGDINDVKVANIVRLVIAGNSIRTIQDKQRVTISMVSRTQESTENIEAMKTLDAVLLKLCLVMDVDIMPGQFDPANHILPQKPMHMCMFQNSGTYKTLNLVSNPYEFEVGGTRLIGTSGQTILDIMRFSEILDPLDAMEQCLKWGHIAPTAPDTLGCYPFYDADPFVMESCPNVMYCGNQKQFDMRMVHGDEGQAVRLISIPEFTNTFTACILNLKTLDCTPISFLE